MKYRYFADGDKETWIYGGSFPTTYGARDVFNVNGDVYNYAPTAVGGNGIYKFNTEYFRFDYVGYENGDIPTDQYPMWADPIGMTRYGINYTVDLSNGNFTTWYHNPAQDGEYVNNYYTVYIGAIDNVVHTPTGYIYVVAPSISKAFVWDWNTNDFTITVPCTGVPDANFYRNHCYYEGKYITLSGSDMYEFVEHFDEQTGEVTSVSFEVVSTPYFPLTTEDNDSVRIPYVHNWEVNGSYVYVDYERPYVYILSNGVWTRYEQFSFDEIPGNATQTGCSLIYNSNLLLFGYGYSSEKYYMIPFTNIGAKIEIYGWDTTIENKVNDLNNGINNLAARVTTLENNYGDALNTTNNILGY